MMQPDQKRHGPDALVRTEAANQLHRARHSTRIDNPRSQHGHLPNQVSGIDPISILLSRLANVRQYGKGWRANCPVGHRSRGTLAVGVGDDDRVLLHCHAGCDAAEVLAAIGLSLADLYPERPRDLSPMGRRAAREAMRSAHWAAAVGVLGAEATVVEVAATMIERGTPLTDDDMARIRIATSRIHGCRDVLHAR